MNSSDRRNEFSQLDLTSYPSSNGTLTTTASRSFCSTVNSIKFERGSKHIDDVSWKSSHQSDPYNHRPIHKSEAEGQMRNMALSDFSSAKKMYTEWTNRYLRKIHSNHVVVELETDLRDGVILAQLIEVITGEKVATGMEQANEGEKDKSINNVSKCMEHLLRFRVINESQYHAHDIVEGDLKTILGLIYNLSRYKRHQTSEDKKVLEAKNPINVSSDQHVNNISSAIPRPASQTRMTKPDRKSSLLGLKNRSPSGERQSIDPYDMSNQKFKKPATPALLRSRSVTRTKIPLARGAHETVSASGPCKPPSEHKMASTMSLRPTDLCTSDGVREFSRNTKSCTWEQPVISQTFLPLSANVSPSYVQVQSKSSACYQPTKTVQEPFNFSSGVQDTSSHLFSKKVIIMPGHSDTIRSNYFRRDDHNKGNPSDHNHAASLISPLSTNSLPPYLSLSSMQSNKTIGLPLTSKNYSPSDNTENFESNRPMFDASLRPQRPMTMNARQRSMQKGLDTQSLFGPLQWNQEKDQNNTTFQRSSESHENMKLRVVSPQSDASIAPSLHTFTSSSSHIYNTDENKIYRSNSHMTARPSLSHLTMSKEGIPSLDQRLMKPQVSSNLLLNQSEHASCSSLSMSSLNQSIIKSSAGAAPASLPVSMDPCWLTVDNLGLSSPSTPIGKSLTTFCPEISHSSGCENKVTGICVSSSTAASAPVFQRPPSQASLKEETDSNRRSSISGKRSSIVSSLGGVKLPYAIQPQHHNSFNNEEKAYDQTCLGVSMLPHADLPLNVTNFPPSSSKIGRTHKNVKMGPGQNSQQPPPLSSSSSSHCSTLSNTIRLSEKHSSAPSTPSTVSSTVSKQHDWFMPRQENSGISLTDSNHETLSHSKSQSIYDNNPTTSLDKENINESQNKNKNASSGFYGSLVSLDSAVSRKSVDDNQSQWKKGSKKGWLRNSIDRAFRKKRSSSSSGGAMKQYRGITGLDNAAEEKMTSSGNSLMKTSVSSDMLNFEEIQQLRKEVEAKDMILTDIRLEALSSAHLLQQMNASMSRMRHEISTLKSDNERLQKLLMKCVEAMEIRCDKPSTTVEMSDESQPSECESSTPRPCCNDDKRPEILFNTSKDPQSSGSNKEVSPTPSVESDCCGKLDEGSQHLVSNLL